MLVLSFGSLQGGFQYVNSRLGFFGGLDDDVLVLRVELYEGRQGVSALESDFGEHRETLLKGQRTRRRDRGRVARFEIEGKIFSDEDLV